MANYLNTFGGTLDLTAQTSDSGQTHSGDTGLLVQNGRLEKSGGTLALVTVDGLTTGSEFDIVAEFFDVNGNADTGFLFCMSDTSNYYYLQIRNGAIRILNVPGFSVLGSVSYVSGPITVEVRASTIEVFNGGSSIIGPITDTTHARAGGLGFRAADGGNSAENYSFLDVQTTDLAASATLDTVPATAFPGETITLEVTGAGATQGTGGVTINGETQTISSWSDTSIDITVVQGDTSYGTGKTVELTTDGGDTDTGTIELVADTASGFGYVDMSSPNTSDESSVAFGATPTVVTGDQFEWEDFNNLATLSDPAIPLDIDSEGFVVAVGGEGTFRGRFWDATDQTWGAVETFTASLPATGTTPDPFTVAALTDQPLGQYVEFAPITISGVGSEEDLPVTVTGAEYAVDSGAGYGEFTSLTTNIRLGDVVKPRIFTSDIGSDEVTGSIDISGTSSALSATTIAAIPQGTLAISSVSAGRVSASVQVSYNKTDLTNFQYSFEGGAWTVFTPPLILGSLERGTAYTGSIRVINATGVGPTANFSFTTQASGTIDSPVPVSEGAQHSSQRFHGRPGNQQLIGVNKWKTRR